MIATNDNNYKYLHLFNILIRGVGLQLKSFIIVAHGSLALEWKGPRGFLPEHKVMKYS